MAEYPTALPTFSTVDSTTPVASSLLTKIHQEALALATKVGVDGSATTTAHDYKLSGLTGSEKAASDADLTSGLASAASTTATNLSTAIANHEADTSTHGVAQIAGIADIPVKATGAELDTGTNDAKFLTAKAFVDSAHDTGWTPARETWTYVSATSFKITGVDVSTKYKKGTRLKFTQTTVKYGVVVDVSFATDTTVTILLNTDYVLVASTISDNFYSYQLSPQGYPDWFAISAPTSWTGIDNGAGSAPTVAMCRGKVEGKTFHGFMRLSSGYQDTSINNFNFQSSGIFPTPVNRASRSIVGYGHSQTAGDSNFSRTCFTIGTLIYLTTATQDTVADNTEYTNVSCILEWEI